MTLADLDFLITPAGTTALAAAAALEPTDAAFLACYDTLRKRYPAEIAKAAVETVLLRRKARSKFADAARMFFTRESLEQASSEVVAAHRAKRFAAFHTVADLGCGIGGDALAFAAVGCHVIAIDNDPLRAKMAAANLAGTSATVLTADVLTDSLPAADALFCDPARRHDGRRFVTLSDSLPPPAAVLARWTPNSPAAFKLAPAVSRDDLEPFAGEVEFVSLHGELKECVLWLGPFRTTRRRATVLPSGDTLTADAPAPSPGIGPVRNIIYLPDPAVTRAGLVTDLAVLLTAEQVDGEGAVLTSDERIATPFAVAYEVLASLPYDAKKLNEVLRGRTIGRVTPIRRGTTLEMDTVVKKLKLKGERHAWVVFTRVEGRQSAVVCDRCPAT